MKHDFELKVQAWLDGELPEHEARQVGAWLAREAEASRLAAELKDIKQALVQNEKAPAIGESREFYWSKIEREIQRQASIRPANDAPWHALLRRYLGPLTGAAALACLLLLAVLQRTSPTFDEISSTSEGVEAVTFHDPSSQMTFVWLQDSSAVEESPAPKTILYEDEPGTVIEL